MPTARLNRWLAGIVERHPPPAVSGRRIKLRYMTQAKTRPPSFIAFCSPPGSNAGGLRRYLVNGLREDFDLPGVPIRLMLRKGENPYEGRKRKARDSAIASARVSPVGKSKSTPLPIELRRQHAEEVGARSSGVFSVVGSSPGMACARISVRAGRG